MARNKYPERTVQRIVDASIKLFLEKGYESTSIQDILDELGDLTKGAIYHHFKSKEDILAAVTDRLTSAQDEVWASMMGRDDMTGLEKMRMLFRTSVTDPGQKQLFRTAPSVLDNPRFFALYVKNIFEESAPRTLQPIVEQGIADGTIPTRYPKQLAEVILLLVNIWINPMVYLSEPEELEQRLSFFQEMMKGLGLDLFDEGLLEGMRGLHHNYTHQSD